MSNVRISKSVIKRLPRYYRFLSELEEQGVERVSSGKLAQIMRTTASQVRQDLNHFGGFGHQGYGYSVPTLREEIINILGLGNPHKAVLIGAGHIGTAIASRLSLDRMGFSLEGIFDVNGDIIGDKINGAEIYPLQRLKDFCRENKIEAAFLCMPKNAAPEVVAELYGSGVKSFWNFTHYDILADFPDAVVENVHLSDMLMTLCYRMNETED
ncbi:MAG: redox-sensing transcriptional repressor Rex [Ruminococcus sp.]|nr:redox-sensing transcriptional repressor Rex [Ruminococcus sp.]